MNSDEIMLKLEVMALREELNNAYDRVDMCIQHAAIERDYRKSAEYHDYQLGILYGLTKVEDMIKKINGES